MKKFKIIYGTSADAFEIIEAQNFEYDIPFPGLIYFYINNKVIHITPKTSTVIEIR